MSKSLRDLLVGLFLGDAHIKRVGVNKAYFTFEQSAKKVDYFNHVYDTVKAENLVKALYKRVDGRYDGKVNTSLHFKSENVEDL